MPYKDKEKEREHKKQFYQEHRKEILAREKQYWQKHKEERLAHIKAYRQEHKEEIIAQHKQYYQKHREETLARHKQYRKEHREKVRAIEKRHESKRRSLGFIPLNKPFEGSEAHHINQKYVIYIPRELHQSIYHDLIRGTNMLIINALAVEYLQSESNA